MAIDSIKQCCIKQVIGKKVHFPSHSHSLYECTRVVRKGLKLSLCAQSVCETYVWSGHQILSEYGLYTHTTVLLFVFFLFPTYVTSEFVVLSLRSLHVTHTYVRMYVCTYVCIYVYMYMYVYVYVRVRVCVCECTRVCNLPFVCLDLVSWLSH